MPNDPTAVAFPHKISGKDAGPQSQLLPRRAEAGASGVNLVHLPAHQFKIFKENPNKVESECNQAERIQPAAISSF